MTTATTTPAETLPEGSLTGDYDIDASHSRIGFAAKHAMVATVRGYVGLPTPVVARIS